MDVVDCDLDVFEDFRVGVAGPAGLRSGRVFLLLDEIEEEKLGVFFDFLAFSSVVVGAS